MNDHSLSLQALAAPDGTRGEAAATVWGCDLTDGYVRINADYTT